MGIQTLKAVRAKHAFARGKFGTIALRDHSVLWIHVARGVRAESHPVLDTEPLELTYHSTCHFRVRGGRSDQHDEPPSRGDAGR